MNGESPETRLLARIRQAHLVPEAVITRALELRAAARARGEALTLEAALARTGSVSSADLARLREPPATVRVPSVQNSLANSGRILPPAEPPAPGRRRFGSRYELVNELGRGGMGVVYRALDRTIQREVALKVLQGTLDQRELERFRREAHLLARIRHPNVVTVLDVGVEEGVAYATFSLVQGRPLSHVVLELEPLVRMLAKIARAVGAAHRAGVVHRDLKPANILVEDATGEPCVLDFGLALDARRELDRLSQTGEIVGTPVYMTPEAARGAATTDDPRVDVYSLGLLLYERLAGGNPFHSGAATLVEVLTRVKKGAPSLASRADVDPVLARLCDRAMSIDPGRRPPDGDSFATELETWLTTPHDEPRRLPPALLLGLGAVTLASVVGLGLALRSRSSHAPPPVPSPTPVVASPTPRPTPSPSPSPGLLHDDEARALEADGQTLFKGDVEPRPEILRHLESMANLFPGDSRAVFWASFARLLGGGHEGAVRRELVRAFTLEPALGDEHVDLALRYFYALGHERAAVALGERSARGGAIAPAIENMLMHVYLKAAPPVADPERAEALAVALLATKTPDTRDVYPESSLLELARAHSRIGRGDAAGAAEAFGRAAAAAPARQREWFKDQEAGVRRGFDPRLMGQPFFIAVAVTPFLREVTTFDQERDHDGPAAVGPFGLQAVNRQLAPSGDPERATLLLLRLADAQWRAHADREALATIEKALSLALPEAPDARALVISRAVPFLFEQADRESGTPSRQDTLARIEALAREVVTPLPAGRFDPRTPDEVADAWLVIARAAQGQGRGADARAALARARALAPVDHRALDALEVELGKR